MIHMKDICFDPKLNESHPYLLDFKIDPTSIRMVMINEIVPPNPNDDFYASPDSLYAQNVKDLFEEANQPFTSPMDLLKEGIYLCNAIKQPKQETTIPKEQIEAYSYLLEKELMSFPNLKVIMAMGDVAKKSLNMIAKRQGIRNVFPSGSTYKQRAQTFYFHQIQAMPAYIMTGENIKIEKSKFAMNVEEIIRACTIIS